MLPDTSLYYFDTSALVKLYVTERGSRRLRGWVGHRKLGLSPQVRIFVSRLVFPETMSAITRRRNDGTLSQQAASGLWTDVATDFMRGNPPYILVEPTQTIVGRAALLVPTHGIRGYDAVQLATALSVQMRLDDPATLLFVSSDSALTKAAKAAGLATADPAA